LADLTNVHTADSFAWTLAAYAHRSSQASRKAPTESDDVLQIEIDPPEELLRQAEALLVQVADGFVREFGRQMFASFGATLPALRVVMFVRTGTTRGS
jgi:hypothetical protein